LHPDVVVQDARQSCRVRATTTLDTSDAPTTLQLSWYPCVHSWSKPLKEEPAQTASESPKVVIPEQEHADTGEADELGSIDDDTGIDELC
jgi:hypothetical protein